MLGMDISAVWAARRSRWAAASNTFAAISTTWHGTTRANRRFSLRENPVWGMRY